MADKQWKTVALSVAKWVFLILIVLFIFWQVFSRGSESRAFLEFLRQHRASVRFALQSGQGFRG